MHFEFSRKRPLSRPLQHQNQQCIKMKRQICALVPILAVISICGYAQDERYYQMSIDEMFELADANSKSIKTYEIYEREADQSVRNARNDRLPSIEFSASASYLGDGWMADRNFSNGMNAPMPHFGNNFAVEAAQVVYAGGSVSSNIAMAKLNYRQAQLNTENNRQNVRFMLVGDYLELYKLDNQSAVFRKNIEQTRCLLSDIRAKYNEGLVIKNDITRYELLLRQRRSTSLMKQEQAQRLDQTEAGIKLAEAALDLARLNLSYTVILAPCDGTTGRKNIQEGQLIQPGQTIVDIVDANDIWVVANYKETQTANIAEGQQVDIKVDAVPGVVFSGMVRSISRATGASFSLIPQDNSAGNFVKVEQRIPVRIEFTADNDSLDMARLRAGMNVECEVKY